MRLAQHRPDRLRKLVRSFLNHTMMIESSTQPQLGWWTPQSASPVSEDAALRHALARLRQPLYLVNDHGRAAAANDGEATFGQATPPNALPLVGYAPPLAPEQFGDPDFLREYGLRYACAAGAMAHAITSVDIVEEMGKHGMLGFFGAAGLPLHAVEAALDRIARNLGDLPYGFNLIHSPHEPNLEEAVANLYLRRGLRHVCASAFLGLTLPIVRYRVHGIHRDPSGRIVTPNHVFAKVSRVEVATQFLSPPPEKFLRQLVESREITEEQAQLAAQIPMAQNLTAEADSGGHTDNRPAIALIPTMLALRDRMQAQFRYDRKLRVGAAGGIATPHAAAAAFAMGADYVMTGSVNQACVESGTSDVVRQMLAEAQQADVVMAPAADMFEMGVKVQVLKRGTMFAMRGAKLYELYQKYDAIDALPPEERRMLEEKYFRAPLETVWQNTQAFFRERDAAQLDRAAADPKYQMALIFRAYLGQASHWANRGEPSRKVDYQIWCGPAMGAFNEWVKGSFLESPQNRRVVTVALNILRGATLITRLNLLRMQGVRLPQEFWQIAPLPLEELQT